MLRIPGGEAVQFVGGEAVEEEGGGEICKLIWPSDRFEMKKLEEK